MSTYNGMRWLKCDLQMQTPADRQHWMGDHLIAGREAEAAAAFASACQQRQLDVIGITDHNFLSKDFIPHLRLALNEIERNCGHKVTLFPGFEFEAAGVGRGVHVLCLFDPDTDLAGIDAVLTECGVGYPRIDNAGQLKKSDKNLKEILQIVQLKHAGIVIMPHATSNDGIFDNDSISEWLQQDQFTNPDLLAIEVSRPVHRMSDGFQKLLRAGHDCQALWKRIRPIATVMSSDNKKLIEEDDNNRPTANSIGYRYSWIKMSSPSIESLRQAFLDHDSRIILPNDVCSDLHPSKRSRPASIQSISIRNAAFLDDQTVHFSPNMNCVIGGRGSGKSTLLEYLRIMLRKDKGKDIDSDTRERIDRIRGTLSDPNTSIEVCWSSPDGVEDRIVWRGTRAEVGDRVLSDPDTYFVNLPVRFYSQQQLNRLTESRAGDSGIKQAQRLLDLVDGFAKGELADLSEREHQVKLRIKDAFASRRKAKALGKDLSRHKQELQEIDRQWKARSEIQDAAKRHQLLQAESKHVARLLKGEPDELASIVSQIDEFSQSRTAFSSAGSPHEASMKKLDVEVNSAKDQLAATVQQAVTEYTERLRSICHDISDWNDHKAAIENADEEFKAACTAKGLTPDDVGRLHDIGQSRSKLQTQIESLKSEIKDTEQSAGNPEEIMKELHQIWTQQFETRKRAALRANELAVLEEGRQRFIEVTAQYQMDQTGFMGLWRNFSQPDKRTRLGKNWDSYGDAILGYFAQENAPQSPWQSLLDYLNDQSSQTTGNDRSPLASIDKQELLQHIEQNEESWERLRCSRVDDVVDMQLFRSDGTLAGKISDGSLSDGQRNTAALALLLAQEGGPLVIDQPEDELDSNFVFRELIPMLRRVKKGRQLIMATHNANLPVNGDAELVYAFEAKDGKGVHRSSGGLDQSPVTEAVLDIMEGTEEAFRRRREKYHF